MTNDQTVETLHHDYTGNGLAEVLDELRQGIVKRGWVSYPAPDPATDILVAALELPMGVRIIVTEMIYDGPPDLPRQDLPSVLARMLVHVLT
jgi:hypothetical protein